MAELQDDSVLFQVNTQTTIQCSPGVIDITGYTHDNYPAPSTYLTTPATCALHCENMPRSAISYYQTLMSIGSNDFTLSFKVNASLLGQHPQPGYGGGHISLLLANLISTTTQQASLDAADGIVFSYRAYNVNDQHLMQIRSRYGGTENYREVDLPLNTTYDVTITRTNLEVVMTVSSNGTWLWDNAANPVVDNTDIHYFVPFCGRGDTGVPEGLASATMWDYFLSYTMQQTENFLEYPEFVLDGVNVTRTADTINFTGMSLNSTPYCRRTVNFTDFDLWLTVNIDELQAACPTYYGGHVLIATFTRRDNVCWDDFNYSYGDQDGITLRIGGYTNDVSENQHFIRFHNNQDLSEPDTWIFQWSGTTIPRVFTINIVQIGTTVYTYIYDPSDLTTPLHTFTHPGVNNATPYQYFLPFCSMSVPTRVPPDCTKACTLPCATSTGALSNYQFL